MPEWSVYRPSAGIRQAGCASSLLRAEGIYLGIYLLIVGLPYFLLWRSYKKALLNFVSVQDEVLGIGEESGEKALDC